MTLKSYKFKGIIETILLVMLLITIDQCSKIFISKIMLWSNFSNINLLPFLDIVFVRNTGVSFGMFSEGGVLGRYFFSALSLTIGTFLTILAIASEKYFFKISLSLISAGAIGNAIDRIYFGGVIDFIDFFVYNFHWPAFNLADSFITLGVILMLIDNFYAQNEN
ncbi:MAG: signal peptidase II [Rickettsiales bacterium]|nr:signal peptidase II [Rickettsiales bacterium]OUV80534.1 MAG: signal peptidase II [Rickettsiales bacterium TMED131]